MTRKLLIFLVCVVIASSSFIPVYAEFESDIIEDSVTNFIPEAETISTPDAWAFADDFQSNSFSTFALSSLTGPHYTFDVSKIDWYTNAPAQVKAVYDMEILNGTASRQMPFVAVYVTSNDSAQALVGVNVGFYVRWNTSSYMKNPRLCVGYITRNDFSTHYLYSATFNKDGTMSNPWRQMTVSDQGSTGLIKYYSGWADPTYTRDIFAYGVNACSVRPSGYSDNALVNFPESDGGAYTVTTFYNSASGGFCSSVFPSSSFVTQYFPNISMQSFSVPTFEEMQAIKQQQQHEETGSWISRLGDRISGFFETLKNWLLWFSAEGSASYTNPFSNILSDIQLFFDNQVSDTNDFKNSLSDTLDNVVDYISSGSGVISSVLTGVPILSAFVAFFVVFSVIRKVVGR